MDNGLMKDKRNYEILEMIRSVVVPATGCTEPVAIALNVATAKQYLSGEVTNVKLRLDMGLLKNALGVAIPGIKKRGPASCAAVGILIGTNEKNMDILSCTDKYSDSQVESLLPIIDVSVADGHENLFIETILVSEIDCVRVITENSHSNIVSITHASNINGFKPHNTQVHDSLKAISKYHISDLIDFANTVSKNDLEFFRTGIKMNTAIAERGTELLLGKCNQKLKAQGYLDNSVISSVQHYTSCASYARMNGEALPVMTVTGSGNQGITLFLPIYIVAKKQNISEEKMLRSIAFAQAFNLYAKHFVGVLSPICSCGIASGVAASVGIVYLLDGTISQIEGAIRTMLSCITGMICDGAKESCANKVGLSTHLAVTSALMSLNDTAVTHGGIITTDIDELYNGIGILSKAGMENVNNVIINLMLERS